MLYIPPPPPVRATDYLILAAVGVAVLAAMWAGIPAFFRIVAWAGDLAIRHGWL